METTRNNKKTDLSIIIPIMNEEDNIDLLAREISESIEKTSWSWECIWVDDFSTDNTKNKLIQLNHKDARHLFIFHDRNYGQSAALATGFRHASADILATLDGDGQNDPADIPMMVKKLLDENADIINGWREKRQDNFVRRISSGIANGFRNWLTGEKIRDVGCALRVFRKMCVKDIPVFKGMHRFFPTLVRMAGYERIFEIAVNHRPRKMGKTKYGINNRLWVGIADTIAVCWMRRRMIFPKIGETSKNIICSDSKSGRA